MPRAFTDEEQSRIRASLIDAGRTCFVRYGMRKTTIDDLVRHARIAKGSFYRFFKNKEALFLELYLQELPAMMKRMYDASFGSTSDVGEALAGLMREIIHEMETNELARVLLDDPTEMEKFLSSRDYEFFQAEMLKAYAPVIQQITEAQARGELVKGSPQQLLFAVGLIKILPLYGDRMAPEVYEAMKEFAPRVISRGLLARSNS